MKAVGITRRVLAFALDGVILFCFLGIIHIAQGYQSALFLKEELPDSLLYSYIFLLLAYLFDQVLCPVLFGRTLTRWLCGYRIGKRDGRNPSLLQSVARFFSIWLIEFLTIGILTFITSLIRKDKAAVHDIISRTYATFPVARHKHRRIRIAVISGFLILGALLLLNVTTYTIHDIFIKPVKQEALSAGLPMYPPKRQNTSQLTDKAVTIRAISLFSAGDDEEVNICFLSRDGDLDTYKLSLGSDMFKVLHIRVPLDDSSVFSKEPSKWQRILLFAVKLDPFLEPPYRIAEQTLHNGDVDFPVLEPVNNVARLTASFLWAIGMPAHESEQVIRGERSFAIIYSIHNEEYSSESIKVIRAGEMEFYDIIAISATRSARNILERVPHEAQIIKEPTVRGIEYEPCSNQGES